MADPDEKPPQENKPTQTQDTLEELTWDIPFSRTIKTLLIREGKFVKNGWVAILVIVVITGCITHSWTKAGVDSKISDLTSNFNYQIAEIRGQLSDVKQERDKYQLMVAPFQAAALKIYTNEPLQDRLDLLATELGEMSKNAQLELRVNGNTNLILFDGGFEASPVVSNFITLTDQEICVGVFNRSKYPAIHAAVDFVVPIGPTNFSLPDWSSQPVENKGYSHWDCDSEHSIPRNVVWNISTIEITTNYSGKSFEGEFLISADNAETRQYYIRFTFGAK